MSVGDTQNILESTKFLRLFCPLKFIININFLLPYKSQWLRRNGTRKYV